MNRLIRIGFTAVFLLLATGLMVAQNAGDYRSTATGLWSTNNTWEEYSGSAWLPASAPPDSSAGLVTIQSGHNVTITADVVVDSVSVVGGARLNIDPGVTVTVAYNNDGMGIDVDSAGTLTVDGTIMCEGRVSGSDSTIVFNDGGVYNHARDEGSVPRAIWNTGSTIVLSGVTANSPSNMSQDFYNLTIDCPGLTSNLNMGMTGNTIHGDITVLQTGASNRYYLTAPNAYVDPITILGNIYVTGGVFSSNGSSSAASIVVHTYGNVYVTAGNFGCSRGSGTSVSWYLYGDTMSVSDAALQNSTSSNEKIQKFIFAKQGTQYLRMSNVTYGGSGTSPVTFQVSNGTTLDIGTTHIPGPVPPSSVGSTGSFLLDSGATLISYHNGPGDEGSIETSADYGGGNSFVNVNVTGGNGNVSVTSYKGAHPEAYDTTTITHYWTVAAAPGITEATMTFYYFDYFGPSEVRGNEANYKALRYAGSGKNWFTIDNSTVDVDFDFVKATGITTVSGDWTVGEPAPPVDAVEKEPELPLTFFVTQNYPNPFNPTTTIRYGLPKDEHVVVTVYNALGQLVATLADEQQSAGVHDLTFDAGRFASGVYLYKVQAGGLDFVRRMVLLK